MQGAAGGGRRRGGGRTPQQGAQVGGAAEGQLPDGLRPHPRLQLQKPLFLHRGAAPASLLHCPPALHPRPLSQAASSLLAESAVKTMLQRRWQHGAAHTDGSLRPGGSGHPGGGEELTQIPAGTSALQGLGSIQWRTDSMKGPGVHLDQRAGSLAVVFHAVAQCVEGHERRARPAARPCFATPPSPDDHRAARPGSTLSTRHRRREA